MIPATARESSFSLAIIAGGQSRRMGQDKALVDLGGKTLIQRVIDRCANLGQSETLLITNAPADYAHLGLPMHADALPGKGALGGIYTAILQANNDWVMTLACDMPFINADLLRLMLDQRDDTVDIVAPRVNGYPQALHAMYRKTCLAPIREQLDRHQLKIIRFYSRARPRYLDEDEYRDLDPQGRAFANLNTPEELAQARQWLRANPSQ